MAGLHLKALDEADLAVIAACLQDALIALGDFAYLAEERRVVFVANRFLWERPESPMRTNVAVSIEQVTGVRYRGLNRADPDALISLLTMARDGTGIDLVFAGSAQIRLETDRIAIQLQDVGEPWPAIARPSHEAPS